MKKCEDIMTPNPICCLPTDNVKNIAEIMKRENVGPIPVIENEQTRKLISIITDRDLALKVVGEGLNTQSTKVETVMSRKVATCRADDEFQRALDTMSANQLRRFIIVDHVNKVLGIISQVDVAARVNQAEKTAGLVIHTYSKIS